MMGCNETNLTRSCLSVITAIRHFALKKVFIIVEELQNIRLAVSSPTPDEVQDVYASNGRIRNEISHKKERMIELSTSMTLGQVQDTVKQAFRNVREEMIPLDTTTDIEHGDAWERVRKTIEPFENEILMTLMHDTFKVADELKRDLEICNS